MSSGRGMHPLHMQYDEENHNQLEAPAPTHISDSFSAQAAYYTIAASGSVPAPGPVHGLAPIPFGLHQRGPSLDSLTSVNSTPQWTDSTFSPASSAGRATFTPSPVQPPSASQDHAQGHQKQLLYGGLPSFLPSPMVGFDFQPDEGALAHLPTNVLQPFGTVDRDGSFVPGVQQPGLGHAQYRVERAALPRGPFVVPEAHLPPQEFLQHLRSSYGDERTSDASEADGGAGIRKAQRDFDHDDAHEHPGPALEHSGERKLITMPSRSRKAKDPSAIHAAGEEALQTSESETRKRRRADAGADAFASTSTSDLGPSVQANNNTKPGEKPRTDCGLALENTNKAKRDKVKRLVGKIMSAKTFEEALGCLPVYSETPTDGDRDSFKAALKKVVGGSGTKSDSTCESCWKEFGVHVPLPVTATPSKHESDYHRGLRTCPACSYLLIHRGTNGAQRHRTWCPVWPALVARGVHEEWLRRCGVLAKPSSQFFSDKAVKSVEKVAKDDSGVRERELLAWLKKETSKLKLPQADKLTPAIADGDREEGATGASGAFATDGYAEFDEDADGECDLDVDHFDASTSGARLNDDSAPTVAPRGNADAGNDSTAGRPSNAGAALAPSLRWGSSSSVRSTEDVQNDGVYFTSRAARNDAESAVGYGDWADVDPVERTNIESGWGGISVASNSAHDVALPIDDGASFDDAMATVGDYVW
ncbi:hypothetical protein EXIGLDRAFT_693218 [Exidia glandulosa HHB12029]|uniref:Uncharacterized protein n=1 Tax=Exidia glandulosa HHB12029 TaxID=1314781 RepID=A0A166AHE9_EXIGL|nr:hypothetical protein EXIGLDRAFT_693218 [Exidia glandulosa HHB12029]